MRKRKSYLYKSLFNFTLTLFVPILSIIFIYKQAETTLKTQILDSNYNNLNQFFGIVNVIADEMQNICISVTNSVECNRYSYYSNYYQEKAPGEILTVKKMLNKFQNNRYHDVFVYFPMENRIISGTNASLTSDYYYDTYYADEKSDFRDEFDEILKCQEKRPTFFVMNRGEEDYYLCVAMKQFNYKEPQLSYVTVVVLEKGFLNQLVVEESLIGGLVLMFDKEGKMILSNDINLDVLYLDKNTEKDKFYQAQIEGNPCMMIVKEAEGISGYYASAIPLEYFWERLYQMRIICGISIAVCVVVSIVIAINSTIRTYRPVKNVVTVLQKNAKKEFDEKEGTEFEFIKKLFEEQKAEQQVLIREINNNEKIRRNVMLLDLLNGKIEEDNNEEHLPNKENNIVNGLEFCSDYFCVAIVLFQTMEENDKNGLLSFVFKNVMEELCNRENKGFVVHDTKDRHVVLMNLREMDSERKMKEVAKSFLKESENFLKQHYQLNMTIGLSDIHEGMDEICDAYKEAGKAISYQYLLDEILIIEYEQIINKRTNFPISLESRLYRMIMDYVKKLASGDDVDGLAEKKTSKKTAGGYVNELVDVYGINKDASMRMMDYFKYEVVSAVNQIMVSLDFSAEDGKRVTDNLLEANSLKIFCKELEKIFELLSKKEKEIGLNNDVCIIAKQYIKDNYHDPKLSLNDVGDKVHLSAAYISRIFKEKYAKSIPLYITEVRIENAKNTLRETEKSIQQIATECGFLSSNVFIKSFKKQEGVTPGFFRELNRKKREEE